MPAKERAYGVPSRRVSTDQGDRERKAARAVKFIGSRIMNLQEYDGKKLVKVMEAVISDKNS